MFDKELHNKTINISGHKSVFVEENQGSITINTFEEATLTKEQILSNINLASVDLSTYENTFSNKIHIDRVETQKLYDWIVEEIKEKESNISLLVGNAGSGKSVILKDLFTTLSRNEIPVLGIKVDKILNIKSRKELEAELDLGDSILSIFQRLSSEHSKVVLLIDQIDALSLSLSSDRSAINSFDTLIRQLSIYSNIRIIISCRRYDLDYDPALRVYKDNKLFRVSLLDAEQVDHILSSIGITIDSKNGKLKEFLRTPLHLKLYCKVGLNKQFDDSITLQQLYDEIWTEHITMATSIDSSKITEVLSLIASKMNEQQHIVVDKRIFNQYNKELSYLLHQDLLQEQSLNKIQFIHQTFFDYTYARTFVTSGNKISDWLKGIHQGLFIRSQVKQTFAYLRDLDIAAYIKELKEVLFGEYRFHLKLLLINDLGFYQNPLVEEKRLVSDFIIKDTLFFQIFLESIQSSEWFKFITSKAEFKKLLTKNNDEIDSTIINLCTRVIWQDTKTVIDFLENYHHKIRIIENVLIQIPESDVALSYELYNKTSSKWNINIRSEYYYLEKVLKTDPDFVICHLKKDFDENLLKIDWSNDKYIPGNYEGLKIYSDLYKQYPNKAIPYFLYVIEEIIKSKQYESSYGLYGDGSFYLYKPNTNIVKTGFYDYKDLYDTVLSHIQDKLLDDLSKSIIYETLNSKYANFLAIGVFYLLKNKEKEICRILNLFIQNDFLLKIDSSEILDYYSKELLANAYPLLTDTQQETVNQSILSTKKDFHKRIYEDLPYTKKKIASNYLLGTYSLISMIPYPLRNKYPELRKVYQEGFRKYGVSTNTEPQEVTCHVGWSSYSQEAYNYMSFDDWRRTFLKLSTEERHFESWKYPSKEGNKREFEKRVSEKPDVFYPFVENITFDKGIDIAYILAGLEGLQKGNYLKDRFQNLCLEIIHSRTGELDEANLCTFLRVLRYIVRNNQNLDGNIFLFIKGIIYQTPDREFTSDIIQRDDIGMEVVTAGINSIRGIAVELIIDCYSLISHKNEIFETLEYIADTANAITRSCAIFNAAWLNNLDKKRAFDLYLRLVKDLNPYLLAIPFHDGHPLLYHMNINFKGLIPFFEKAIQVKEAGKPMAFFLLNAYINNHPKAFTLLKNLLNNSSQARQELTWYICAHILEGEHAKKGWRIINYLLNFDDKELYEKFNNCFLHIPSDMDSNLISFINKYVKSPVSNYSNNYFYDFLRKLINFNANQCLIWFFASKPESIQIEYFYDKSPLNVLIEGYNGIREYDKENPILEKTMDVFDSLLQIPQYRNFHMRSFLNELEC